MNTIVCNTLSGAVSEYADFNFHSITPKYAGDSSGLYELIGGTDEGRPIDADVHLPSTLRESTLKKSIKAAFFSMRGKGTALFTVHGPEAEQWTYDFPLRDSGQTRCIVGRGIRENYLGFSLKNTEGQYFTLDRVEIMASASKNRRTQ